jgi:hypothetical protein
MSCNYEASKELLRLKLIFNQGKSYGAGVGYLKTSLEKVSNVPILILLGELQEDDVLPSPLPKELRSKTLSCGEAQKLSRQTRQGFLNPFYHKKTLRKLSDQEIEKIIELWNQKSTYKNIYRYLQTLSPSPVSLLHLTTGEQNPKTALSKILRLTKEEFIKICKEERTQLIVDTRQNPEVKKKISEGVRRARSQGRGSFHITKLQLSLFQSLDKQMPGEWIIETPQNWYDGYTPDLAIPNLQVAIEIDGWWIHGPLLDSDSEYIKKSKKKHHYLDNIKNNLATQNNFQLIRIIDIDLESPPVKEYTEEIIRIIHGQNPQNNLFKVIGKKKSI